MSRRLSMLLGLDAFATLILVAFLIAVVPRTVPLGMVHDLYGLAASVLSIVFSVFTASLAIIISSPDDKFVQFLESEGLYSDILFGFKFTLYALFAALVYSLAAYALSAYQLGAGHALQHRAGLITGAALLTYSLAATLSSSLAAIRHARARAEFLRDAV